MIRWAVPDGQRRALLPQVRAHSFPSKRWSRLPITYSVRVGNSALGQTSIPGRRQDRHGDLFLLSFLPHWSRGAKKLPFHRRRSRRDRSAPPGLSTGDDVLCPIPGHARASISTEFFRLLALQKRGPEGGKGMPVPVWRKSQRTSFFLYGHTQKICSICPGGPQIVFSSLAISSPAEQIDQRGHVSGRDLPASSTFAMKAGVQRASKITLSTFPEQPAKVGSKRIVEKKCAVPPSQIS